MLAKIALIVGMMIPTLTFSNNPDQISRAERLIHSDSLDLALSILNGLDPDDIHPDHLYRYHFSLAYTLDEKDDLKNAYIHYNKASGDSRYSHQITVSARKNMAIILRKHHLYDQAREQYDRALDIVPLTAGDHNEKKASILYNYAITYYHQKNYQEAAEYFDLAAKMTDRDKLYLKIHNYIGLCAMYSHFYGPAVRRFEEQIRYASGHPDDPFYQNKVAQAHHNIAEIKRTLSQYDEAEQHYRSAIRMRTHDEDLFLDHLEMGDLYLRMDQKDKAVLALTKAIGYYNGSNRFEDIKVYKLLSRAHQDPERQEYFLDVYDHKVEEVMEYQEAIRQEILRTNMLNVVDLYSREEKIREDNEEFLLIASIILTIAILLAAGLVIRHKWRQTKTKDDVSRYIEELQKSDP